MENMVKLPPKYDLVQGDPFELFYKGVLLCKNPYHYYIKAESQIKGHAFERGIYCENHVPGQYDLKLTVRNDAGDIVGQGITKLVVKEKMKNPKEPCYVLCMGASQTAGGTWPERFKGKLGELSKVVFVGKKQTEAGVHFEGEGGWTFDNYTNPHALHQFWVRTGLNHGKDTEDQESVYRDELGQLWRLETIDYWRLKFRRCGGETEVLPPQGKLFWEEGGKNKNTIVYDQVSGEASSPFVYDGKVILDLFSKYGIVEHETVSIQGDLYMVFSNCPQALSTANNAAWIEEGRPVEQGKEAIQWMKLGYILQNGG